MSTIITSNNNDQIKATDTADIIESNGGNDTINSKGGDDVISAGAGDDIVRAGEGHDTVDGGAGNDYIIAGEGDDTVAGGSGDDLIRGEAGDDTLYGDEIGGFTFVEISTFNYQLNRLREVVSLDGTVVSSEKSQQNGQVQYSNIVTIDAEDSPDTLRIEVDRTFLDAGEGLGIDDGDDTIATQKRIDGDEKLSIVINEDPSFNSADGFSFTLDNFEGLLSAASVRVEVFLDGTQVGDITFDGAALVSGDNGSTVTISSSVDTPAFDRLLLSVGNETTSFSLRGFSLQLGQVTASVTGSGNDNIQGGEGHDLIFGGLGEDILTGNLGDDILSGGANKDTLTGGSGKDTFVFIADDILDPGDTITDFEVGVDILDVTQLLPVLQGSAAGSNPFATGHLGVSQTSNGFTLNVDFDGGTDSAFVLANVTIAHGSLTSFTDAAYLASTLLG